MQRYFLTFAVSTLLIFTGCGQEQKANDNNDASDFEEMGTDSGSESGRGTTTGPSTSDTVNLKQDQLGIYPDGQKGNPQTDSVRRLDN